MLVSNIDWNRCRIWRIAVVLGEADDLELVAAGGWAERDAEGDFGRGREDFARGQTVDLELAVAWGWLMTPVLSQSRSWSRSRSRSRSQSRSRSPGGGS
jgi:hypothetical protein